MALVAKANTNTEFRESAPERAGHGPARNRGVNESKWWGWGDPATVFDIKSRPGMVRYLREHFGITEVHAPRSFDLRSVRSPPSRLPENLLSRFCEILGAEHCRSDDAARVRYALGKSYHDLLILRGGRLEEAPDAVLFASTAEQIQKIFALCHENRIALIPFGGGTSVVGGVNAVRGGFHYLVTLVLTRMDRVLEIDETSLTAVIEAGRSGPDIEEALRGRGVSLGHFPQSFEYSTLGGWIAARSAGQNCLAYGNIERMVVSLRVITPSGEVRTLEAPNHACGPDLKQLLLGSEGVCGVIVSARVRIHRVPEAQDYFIVAFPSFMTAAETSRGIVQSGANPALIRVSDEAESTATLAFSDKGGLSTRLARAYLKLRGISAQGPLAFMLVGFEGTPGENRKKSRPIERLLAHRGAVSLGRRAGRHWLRERFRLPYLRDELMDHGLFVETLETATLWHRLPKLHADVRTALQSSFEKEKLPCVVFTHLSHLYPDGASLYFTVIGQAKMDDPLSQWRAVKLLANEAIRSNGAAISHHHGIGTDHRSHLHWSALEAELVKNLKKTLDPSGILNPGKLLP